MRKSWLAFASISIGVSVAAPAWAAEPPVAFEVTTGIRYTDNVLRTDVNEEAATIGTAGFLVKALRDTGALRYKADGGIDYLHYFTGHIGDEALGDFSGMASYAFVPETFTWVIDEHFGQINTDFFLPQSPINRQYYNVVDSGPDLHLRLADTYALRLTGRYGLDIYQKSPLNNDRLTGEAALEHSVTQATLIGLGGSRESVRYFNAQARPFDFDVDQFFASYDTKLARTKIEAQLGYSESTGSLTSVRGVTGLLKLERKVSGYSVLTADVERKVQSAAQGATGFVAVPNFSQPGANGQLSGEPIIFQTYSLGWKWQRTRTALDLEGAFQKQSAGADSNGDLQIHSALARITRRFTSLTQASLFANWYREEAPGPPVTTATNTSAGVTIQVRFATSLVASFDISHTNNSSDTPSASYRENVAWLRIGYAPRWAEMPVF